MARSVARHAGRVNSGEVGPPGKWAGSLGPSHIFSHAADQSSTTGKMKPTPVLLLFPLLLASPSAAQTDLRLIPQPREIQLVGSVSLPNGISIGRPANAEDRFAALDLANSLKERGIRVVTGETGPGPHVVLLRAGSSTAQSVLRRHSLTLDPAMQDEGYFIAPDGNRIVVIGMTSAGVFYGAQSVKQIVSGDGDQARLYRATIRDWPAMRYRGFHDD